MQEAIAAASAEDNYFISTDASSQVTLLSQYRNHLITHYLATELTKGVARLEYSEKMFAFQPVDSSTEAYKRHAADLVDALHLASPVAGITSPFPEIETAQPLEEENQVLLTFAEPQQAEKFLAVFQANFSDEPEPTTQSIGKRVQMSVATTHFKQLLAQKKIAFKVATVPLEIDDERSLTDSEGTISLLQLIQEKRALSRLVSTTPLKGEDFPDYEYLFDALDDPIYNRYVGEFLEDSRYPVDRTRFFDPRTQRESSRKLAEYPAPRFQVPCVSLNAENIEDEWVISKQRGAGKNTIFIKKLAHFLIPANGKITPFEGYRETADNYYPIGVILDREEVDLKRERYLWLKHAGTVAKRWVRYNQETDKKLLKLVSLKDRKIRRSPNIPGILASINQILHEFLEHRFVHPSDEALTHCLDKINECEKEFNSHKDQDAIQQQLNQMKARLEIELKKQHSKYAVSLPQLLAAEPSQSEILAATTKSAVKGLHSVQDHLFDRLNLAYHGLNIRKEHGYSLPLLIMSENHPPYLYTEQKLREDLYKLGDIL